MTPETTILPASRDNTLLSEIPSLVKLAIPLVAGSASYTFYGLINTFFLGGLGEVPLAVASLTVSISIIFFAALYGMLGPIGYLIGTAHGANDSRKIAEVMQHGLLVAAGVGAVGAGLMALTLFALPYMNQPLEVRAVITPYWLLSALTLIPFCITFVYKQFYDSTDKAWTGTTLALVPVVLNVPLAWILVTGQFGIPALGLEGAGWAALIGNCIGTAIMAGHFHFTAAHKPFQVWSKWHKEAFLIQLREGLPMGIQYLLEGGAIAVAGVLIGWLGSSELAANQIVFSVLGILYIVPIGMSIAVGIRVSQATGGGEKHRARNIGMAGMLLASGWSLVFTVLLIIFGSRVAALFVTEPDVIKAASLMFVVWGAAQVFDGIQSVGVGVLRGIFDNRYPTVVSLIAYWLISLPLSYAFGFWFGWGGAGIWAGFCCGLAIASVLLVRRLWKMTSQTAI
jgi:multidrug resistance protein, MATE family